MYYSIHKEHMSVSKYIPNNLSYKQIEIYI